MKDEEARSGQFVSAEGDTMYFTRDEVARALLFFVTKDEAEQAATELYAVDPKVSGVMFDANLISALEMLSPEVAERIARQMNESPEEAEERRAQFRALLKRYS